MKNKTRWSKVQSFYVVSNDPAAWIALELVGLSSFYDDEGIEGIRYYIVDDPQDSSRKWRTFSQEEEEFYKAVVSAVKGVKKK